MTNTVASLHHWAMMTSDVAWVAMQAGETASMHRYRAQALIYEIAACRLLAPLPANEPTRAILYVSAGSLAFQYGRWRTMGRLARAGLRGHPAPREWRTLTALARLARTKGV